MDHLKDRCGRDEVAHARVRRGQLVLVAGFALAVTFVALALLLNSAIFAENLATRQTGGDAAEAEQISGSVDQALRKQLKSVNRENSGYDYTDLAKDLKRATDNWSDLTNRQLATDGTSLRVTLDETTNGTRIRHTAPNEVWEDRHGSDDWTLFTDTDPADVRWFQLNISREGLLNATLENVLDGLSNNAFHIQIEEESGPTRDIYIFRGNLLDNNVYVMAGDNVDFDLTDPFFNDVSSSCTVNQKRIKIDLWEGRVNGFECEELSFIENISGDVNVSYQHADGFLSGHSGTYDISLNSTSGIDDDDDGDDPYYEGRGAGESPFVQSQVTQVTVQRQVQRTESVYTETTTVEPATRKGYEATDVPMPEVSITEPDRIGFSILGNLFYRYEFTVNWRVKDANGDLENLEVSVTPDPHGKTPWNPSVSGTSDEGSNTFECDQSLFGSCSDTYTITVTATDEAGHSRTVTREFKYSSGLLGLLGL